MTISLLCHCLRKQRNRRLVCAGSMQLCSCATACVPAPQGWHPAHRAAEGGSSMGHTGKCARKHETGFLTCIPRCTKKLFLHILSTLLTLRELSWNSGTQTTRSCSRIKSIASAWRQRRDFCSARAGQSCQASGGHGATPWTWHSDASYKPVSAFQG